METRSLLRPSTSVIVQVMACPARHFANPPLRYVKWLMLANIEQHYAKPKKMIAWKRYVSRDRRYKVFFATQNLVIDKLMEDDAICLHRICNQSFVLKWMKDWKHNLDEIRELLAFFTQGYSFINPAQHALALAIRLKDTKDLIGICGFGTKEELGGEVEICYFIDEAFSNKGYMSQVIEKAIKYYFDLTDKTYLCAMVDRKNEPSYRLLKRNGFVFYPMSEKSGVESHYRVYR